MAPSLSAYRRAPSGPATTSSPVRTSSPKRPDCSPERALKPPSGPTASVAPCVYRRRPSGLRMIGAPPALTVAGDFGTTLPSAATLYWATAVAGSGHALHGTP